jgi:serine/threonine-protein kinase
LAARQDPIDLLRATLSDRYDVGDEVGHGGMATVFAALDRRTGARVAIKLLRPELAITVGDARFEREIRLTARLQHPHVLPVLDSGVAGTLPYYVMPFVEGESLAARLAREDRLAVDEAVRLVAEIADGLAHAHAQGIIHRDIKPGNILLSHGHAVLADFGIAKALDVASPDRLTESGVAMGTVTYMSPEQAGNERVDGRSDQYALACVLYETLAGTPPFTGASAQTIMARHAVDPVPNIRTVRPSVPQALATAIETALAKVPQDRHASITAFRDAILHGAAQPATAPTMRVVARPVVASRRWLGWGAAVVAAVALLGALFHRAGPRRDALDARRVMVFPFVGPTDGRRGATAGEDVATLVGSAMDGAGELRWVDGWSHLSSAQRTDLRQFGAEDALAISRAQRCAFAITGRIVTRGDSSDVVLELLDVAGDSVIMRSPSRTEHTPEVWRAGLAAVATLLPRLVPGAPPDIEASWATRPPQAVAHFLAGEAAFRRVQLADALAAFQRAVAADSTFALAAVRGAQSASWAHRASDAAALAEVARRHALSPRDAAFARGLVAFLDGRADSAAAAMREAIALDSLLVPAWMQLGEIHTHLVPAEGAPDSLAKLAFDGAFRLDSTSATASFHLIEIAARAGDAARVARLARGFARVAADTQLLREVALLNACASGTLGTSDVLDAARRSPLALLLASKALASSALTAGCAAEGFRSILLADSARTDAADGRRYSALLGLVAHEIARGNDGEAIEVIEAFRARWDQGRSLYVLAAPVSEPVRARAAAVMQDAVARYGAGFSRLSEAVPLWEFGVLAASTGRATEAEQIARTLATRAAVGGRLDSLVAASMAAHAALAAGDSALALQRFDALIRAQPAPSALLSWDEAAALGIDRLMLGRVLLARGQADRALRVLDALDAPAPIVFPLYQVASLSVRARAAQAMSRPQVAQRLRERAAAWSRR